MSKRLSTAGVVYIASVTVSGPPQADLQIVTIHTSLDGVKFLGVG